MTGTFLLDALGVAILALCSVVFGLVLIAILAVYIGAVVDEIRRKPTYDHRDHGRSPDWPN